MAYYLYLAMFFLSSILFLWPPVEKTLTFCIYVFLLFTNLVKMYLLFVELRLILTNMKSKTYFIHSSGIHRHVCLSPYFISILFLTNHECNTQIVAFTWMASETVCKAHLLGVKVAVLCFWWMLKAALRCTFRHHQQQEVNYRSCLVLHLHLVPHLFH